MTEKLNLFIEGQFIKSDTKEWIEVLDPATQEVLCEAPCAKEGEKAKRASPEKKIFFCFIFGKLLLTKTGKALISLKFSNFIFEFLFKISFKRFFNSLEEFLL